MRAELLEVEGDDSSISYLGVYMADPTEQSGVDDGSEVATEPSETADEAADRLAEIIPQSEPNSWMRSGARLRTLHPLAGLPKGGDSEHGIYAFTNADGVEFFVVFAVGGKAVLPTYATLGPAQAFVAGRSLNRTPGLR